MPAPLVSVLLTTWNRPDMLAGAVDSVFAQTFTGWELLILDDNSDDPAQQAALEGYREDPKIRVLVSSVTPAERRDRVRYAVLANLGLREARGKYVTYLCDDDLYLPERLELMVARLEKGDCQVVYGGQELRYQCEGEQNGRDRAPGRIPEPDDILASAWWKVDHSSVMHARQAGLDAGGWDEDPAYWKHADSAFWRRLNAAGHSFYPVCAYTDSRLFHDGSETSR